MLPPPLPHQVGVLREVLDFVAEIVAAGTPSPVVVFGLDGVVYDTRPRTLQILHEYADACEGEAPDVAEALRALEVSRVHRYLTDTLAECQIYRGDLIHAVTTFWHERFHADEYVGFDQPNPGAVGYVRACHEQGATVVYLSRRDVPGMLLGTMACLRDHGFPVAVPGVELALKPDATFGDESFKRTVIPQLSRPGPILAFFDNDLMCCELARDAFPQARIAYVDAWQIDAVEPEERIEVVRDFRLG